MFGSDIYTLARYANRNFYDIDDYVLEHDPMLKEWLKKQSKIASKVRQNKSNLPSSIANKDELPF